MYSQKISPDEIADIKVSSLPTRPNAPTSLGGVGFTASQMKEAFDALPIFIIDRLNLLIDDIRGVDGGNISDVVKSGIKDGHTLENFFEDIKDGTALSYIQCFGSTLGSYLEKLRTDINTIAERTGVDLE